MLSIDEIDREIWAMWREKRRAVTADEVARRWGTSMAETRRLLRLGVAEGRLETWRNFVVRGYRIGFGWAPIGMGEVRVERRRATLVKRMKRMATAEGGRLVASYQTIADEVDRDLIEVTGDIMALVKARAIRVVGRAVKGKGRGVLIYEVA